MMLSIALRETSSENATGNGTDTILKTRHRSDGEQNSAAY